MKQSKEQSKDNKLDNETMLCMGENALLTVRLVVEAMGTVEMDIKDQQRYDDLRNSIPHECVELDTKIQKMLCTQDQKVCQKSQKKSQKKDQKKHVENVLKRQAPKLFSDPLYSIYFRVSESNQKFLSKWTVKSSSLRNFAKCDVLEKMLDNPSVRIHLRIVNPDRVPPFYETSPQRWIVEKGINITDWNIIEHAMKKGKNVLFVYKNKRPFAHCLEMGPLKPLSTNAKHTWYFQTKWFKINRYDDNCTNICIELTVSYSVIESF